MRPGFLLGEVANGLRRNASMVVSVVLVTMVSLFFLGLRLLQWCIRLQAQLDVHREMVGADVRKPLRVDETEVIGMEDVIQRVAQAVLADLPLPRYLT